MLSGRFTDSDGKLYVFMQDHPDNGIFKTTPKNILLATHLYSKSTFDGNKDYEIEYFFSELEGRVSPILDRIIESSQSNSVPNLSGEEKDSLDKYYYTQIKRTPDALGSMPKRVDEDIIADTISRHESETGESVTPSEYADLHSSEMVQNARAGSLRMSGRTLEIINESELCISVNTRLQDEFVIGSNPIVLPRFYSSSQLAIPNVEWWLPVAPNVAIRPSLSDLGDRPVLPFGVHERLTAHDAKFVSELNYWTFRQSAIVVGRSRELIESLVERVAAKLDTTLD